MRMRVALLSLAVFCLWNASARAATFSFSDGDFNDSDWGIEFFNLRGGGTAPAGQEVTGGNPGSYRSVLLTTNPAPNPTENSAIYAFHGYIPGVVDPSVDGAIVSFDLFWDVRPGPDTFGNGGFAGPALRQGDRFYVSAGLLRFVGTDQEWHSENRLDLVEANFGRIQDNLGGDPADDPDFSASGEPITFGFFSALAGGIGGGSVSLTQGYDNWSVVVQTVPEASPVPALSLWSLPLIAALLLVSSFLVLRSRPEN